MLFLNYLRHLFSQRVLYFPLKPRLRKLLSIEKYKRMCQHEFFRPRNDEFLCDVYDGSAWKEFMGPIRYPNDRIGLQWCIDSFPINSEGSKSMKPGCWMNMSLPPTERAKPANMLISIIIPCSVKDVEQRKYYNFMADYELRDLFYEGAHCHYAFIVVKLFVLLLIDRAQVLKESE